MKPQWIARQSSDPRGWVGEIVARVMSFETAPANRAALETLAVRPGETVLEIGCGHGRTLARLAACGACVVGIDPSEVMVRLARRRARRWIESGRADVTLASSAKIPHADGCFDAAFAMHVVYFWREPLTDLREIHRVLRTGGRLLLGYRARDAKALASLPASVYVVRSAAEVEALLAEVGFTGIRSVERSGFHFTSGLRGAG
jgi:SAM-dependent methyltransferase